MNELQLEKLLRADDSLWPQDQVVEVPVLLESKLLPLLASAATGQGLTTGMLIRRLIHDFLDDSTKLSPPLCTDACADCGP